MESFSELGWRDDQKLSPELTRLPSSSQGSTGAELVRAGTASQDYSVNVIDTASERSKVPPPARNHAWKFHVSPARIVPAGASAP